MAVLRGDLLVGICNPDAISTRFQIFWQIWI